MNLSLRSFFSVIASVILCSCTATGQVSKQAVNDLLNDSAIRTGHIGISIYDPATKKYIYNYNADKNFMPSSNVKLFTLYAGMKYLGDSLAGIRYYKMNDSITIAYGTGDPTFLHPDFPQQPVFDFLIKQDSLIFGNTWLGKQRMAPGWAWEDYVEEFMPERSGFPIYGNLIRLFPKEKSIDIIPSVRRLTLAHMGYGEIILLDRELETNTLSYFRRGEGQAKKEYRLPMVTSDAMLFLKDTIHRKINFGRGPLTKKADTAEEKKFTVIRSQPTDSLFRPMMFNSDNFFAEQTLLMVSNERLGYMTDQAIIDTLLKTDLRDIPTTPRWVDGSGLSRYNLFSPKDFVYILEKIKNEFPRQRIKNILPTGGQGTLKGYYVDAAGAIYAKTGSMSNNTSISGYLVTKKNKNLLFSVIVNNFSGSGSKVRRAIEQFLLKIKETN